MLLLPLCGDIMSQSRPIALPTTLAGGNEKRGFVILIVGLSRAHRTPVPMLWPTHVEARLT